MTHTLTARDSRNKTCVKTLALAPLKTLFATLTPATLFRSGNPLCCHACCAARAVFVILWVPSNYPWARASPDAYSLTRGGRFFALEHANQQVRRQSRHTSPSIDPSSLLASIEWDVTLFASFSRCTRKMKGAAQSVNRDAS